MKTPFSRARSRGRLWGPCKQQQHRRRGASYRFPGGWVLRFAREYTLNRWPKAAELVCVMDLYTQIQDKLHDLSKRFAHEARYFQERAPLGVDEEDAGAPQRLPLTEQPFSETKETLGLRAGCAARCIMALNEQLDMLLSSLPADEGDEEGLDKVLEELCRENIRAGDELNIEAEKGEKLLKEMRDALHRMCPAPTVIPPEVRLPKLDKARKGAAKGAGDESAEDDAMDIQQSNYQ